MSEVHHRTSASADQVFAVLQNGWLYPSWVVGAARLRAVDADWPGTGSKLHHSVGLWPALINDETEVLACEPPHRLVLQARAWPAGEATVELQLTEQPTGCVITIREDATEGPAQMIPEPVRRLALIPRNRETLRRLALIAEGNAATGTDPAPHPADAGPAEAVAPVLTEAAETAAGKTGAGDEEGGSQ